MLNHKESALRSS